LLQSADSQTDTGQRTQIEIAVPSSSGRRKQSSESSKMKSWIVSANVPGSQFPIQNLPYGVFRGPAAISHCCVAIGDQILDLTLLEEARLIETGCAQPVFDKGSLNPFMALGPAAWRRLRARLTELLVDGGDASLRSNNVLRQTAFRRRHEVAMLLPCEVRGYTDFYAGQNHALNVGAIFRGDNVLPHNWLSIPIGYNGRASTVVVSGTDIRRPLGQMKPSDAEFPFFGPTRQLDFELEIGAVVGVPSNMGEPITVAEADEMIFGYVLLNDWSARDIQAWEYQPLGPFQGKAFATSISPWIVTKEALEPFRLWTPERQRKLLPYLREPGPMLYDVALEVALEPAGGGRPTTISRTNYREVYYSAPQLLAHHAICGCRMETGDLLGSGTISGRSEDSYGSLLELSWGAARPISLETGETRCFLEDGDRVALRGYADGDGYRIGFGECTGSVLPASSTHKWSEAPVDEHTLSRSLR
jgi:fumarylacetoacetase